jgi:hypothetical protein
MSPNPLTISEHSGIRFLVAPQDRAFLLKPADVTQLIEACFSARVNSALLHAANMPGRFFDLSSGEAGEILQKLRNYRIRVALVCPQGSVTYSTNFRALMAEENRLPYFRFFESADAAREWLILP